MKYFIGTTLNFVCPGLGNVLYGELSKGVFTFFVFMVGLGLMIYFNEWLWIIMSGCVWVYGIFSMYNVEKVKREKGVL